MFQPYTVVIQTLIADLFLVWHALINLVVLLTVNVPLDVPLLGRVWQFMDSGNISNSTECW